MPRRLHDVTEVILIIVLSEVALIITAQSNERSIFNGVNNQSGGRTPYSNQRSQLKNTTNGYHIDLDLGLCREGWVKGHMRNVPVCLRLNKEPLSWSQSRDQCRLDKAFLVKLETPVTVGSKDIRDFLQRRNIHEFWSGLHTENDHFVWDELAPHTARAYNDELESRLEMEKIWQWMISERETDDKSEEQSSQGSTKNCGKISLPKPEKTRRKRSIRRHKRQTEDLIDNLEYPSPNAHNDGMPNHEFNQMMQPQEINRNNINNHVDGIPGADFSQMGTVTSSREIADPTVASMAEMNQNYQNKQRGIQHQIQAYIQSNGQMFQERLNKRIQDTGMTQPQVLQLLKQMQQTIRNSRDSLLDDNNKRHLDNHSPLDNINNRPVENNFRMPDIDRRPVSAVSMMNTNTGRASTPVMHSPTGPNMKRLSDDFLKRTTNPVMGNLASDVDIPDMDTENIMALWNRRNPISKLLKDKKNASPTQVAFPKEEANSWIQKFRTTVGESEIEHVPTQIPLIQGAPDLDSESTFNSIKPSSLSSKIDNTKKQLFIHNDDDKQINVKSVSKPEQDRDGILETEWQSERDTKESGPSPPEPDSLATVMPPPLPIKSVNQNLRNVTSPTTPLPGTTNIKLQPQAMTTEEDVLSGINFNALFDEIIKDDVENDKANVSTKSYKQQTQKPMNTRSILPEILNTDEKEIDDIRDDRDIHDKDDLKTSIRTAAVDEENIKPSNRMPKIIPSDNGTMNLQVETHIDNIPPPTISTSMEKLGIDIPLQHHADDEFTDSLVDDDMKSNSTSDDIDGGVFPEEPHGIDVDIPSNETIDIMHKVVKTSAIHDDEIDDNRKFEKIEDLIEHEKLPSNDTNDVAVSDDSHDDQRQVQAPPTPEIKRKLIRPTKDTVILTDVVEDDEEDTIDSDEDIVKAYGGTVAVQKNTETVTDDDDELLSSEEDEDIDDFTDEKELSTATALGNTTTLSTNETSTGSSLIKGSDEDIFDGDFSTDDMNQNTTYALYSNITTTASNTDTDEITSASEDELHSAEDDDEVSDTSGKPDNSTELTSVPKTPLSTVKIENDDEAVDHHSAEKTEKEEEEDVTEKNKHLTKVPVYEASSDYEFSEPKMLTETQKSHEDDSSSEKDSDPNSPSVFEAKPPRSEKDKFTARGKSEETAFEPDDEHSDTKEDTTEYSTTPIPVILVPPPPIPNDREIDESNEVIEEAKTNLSPMTKKEDTYDDDKDDYVENGKDDDGLIARKNDDKTTIGITKSSIKNSSKGDVSRETKYSNEKEDSNEVTENEDSKHTDETKVLTSSTSKPYVESSYDMDDSAENDNIVSTSGENNDVSNSKDNIMPMRPKSVNTNETSDSSEEELESTKVDPTNKEQDSKEEELEETETTRERIESKVKDPNTESHEEDDESIATEKEESMDSENERERSNDKNQVEIESSEEITENGTTSSFEGGNLVDSSGEDVSSFLTEVDNRYTLTSMKEHQSSEEEEENEEIEDSKGMNDSSSSIPNIVTDSSKEDSSNVEEVSEEINSEIEEKYDNRNMSISQFNITNEIVDDSEESNEHITEKEDEMNSNSFSQNMTSDINDDSDEITEEIVDKEEIKDDRHMNDYSSEKTVDSEEPNSEENEKEEFQNKVENVSRRNISNASYEDTKEVEDHSMEEKEYNVMVNNNSLHASNEVVDDDKFIDEVSNELEEHTPLLRVTSNEQTDSSEEYMRNNDSRVEITNSKENLRNSLQDDEILKSVERESEEVIEDSGWGENIDNSPKVKIEKKRESGEQVEDFEYADENESHLRSEAAVQDEYRQAEEQDLEPAGDSQYVNDDVEYEPKDGNDGGEEQDDEWNDDTNADMKMIGKASMEMEECDNTMSSMCYSYPITAEKGASTCDTDWYGHVFMDKCYRAIKDIDRIPYLNYQYGTKLCQALGGRIAEIRDGFGGKFIMLTLLKSMREFNMQGEPPGVWVNSEPIGTSCTMLTRSGPLAVSCDTNNMAVTICEKTATNPGLTLEHASDHQHMTYPVYFYSDDANKELTCGITGHANELPTLWFKDGRLIDIRVKKRLESVLPHQGGRPISPLPEPAESPTSSLILGSVLKKTLQRSTDQFLTDDVFQGTYWCEVWDLKPFRRHSSAPYSVRFSDVVTMVGTVHLPFIRNDDVILHDKIQKNVNTVRNVEYDLNFINSIILPSLRRAVPDIKELSTYAKEIIGTKPFTLKFHTYIKMNGNYSMATEIMIFRTLRRFYREVVRNPEVLLRLPRKTPLHLIRSMNVRSTVSCPQTLLTDTITGHSATFPSSAIGMKVDSFEICGGERSGQAFCTGDFSSGAYWTDVHIWKSCGQSLPPPPNTVNLKDSDEVDDTDEKEDDDSNDYDTLVSPMTPEERLKELAEMTVGEDNVEGVMEETADITESVDDLNELDVEYIAEIMKKTANTARIGKFVAAKAMRTVDRVLSMHHRRAVKSRKASQIIKNFEKIAEDAEIDDDSGHFRMVMSNIALDVYQLHRHKRPVLGFGAKAAQTRRMDSDFSPNRIFTIYDQTDMYRDVDVAIQLPPDLIDEATAGKRRLFMMVYKKGNLFQDDSIPINVSGKVNVDGGHDLKLINSYVISASLGGKKIQGLSNKVKTIYRPLTNPDGSQRTCAFYDFAMNNLSGGWSSAGCVFNGTSNGREICLCDHLTNFAVLIDFYGQRKPVEREHEETLSIISLIGLSLSILGLSLTIISYLFFRKLRQGRAQQTLFNLALAMLFSWVVFLVGIKQTYHYIGCLIVAALLHYFILASFMWMLMEAFLQYLTFVKVLGTYVRRYTLKSVLVAWGLPAVPVISVLSIDYTLYKGGDQYCWMSLDAFYYAFAIPVGVIILSNLIVFVITVVSIYRRPAGLRSNQSKHKMAITNLQAAITSFVLLGLSWILGYFAISDARLPFHYAFTILNSLQGFFIFVIFVVRKKQVRDQWLIACCCKTPEQQKAQRSLSASASIPSTCSAKSTRSSSSTSSLQQRSRPDRSDSCQTTTSFISAEYDSIYALPYSKVSRDSLYYRKF